MGINFTQDQSNAINSRGGSLIVSAAAGSGKTAVLVQRVLNMIINGEANISDFIIVTFTEAAASEMKNKIVRAILEKIEENPKNIGLKRQLNLMSMANIQTVHSFCSGIIKNNFHRYGVSHDFGMLDDSEKKELQEEIIEDILEKRYAHFKENEDFQKLFMSFSNDRGDFELKTTILELYEKLRSHPNPTKWCEYVIKTADGFEGDDALNHNWGRFIFNEAKELHKNQLQFLKKAYEDMESVTEVFEKYKESYENALEYGENIENAFKVGWDETLTELKQFQKLKFKPCKYEDKEYTSRLRSIRDSYADTVETIRKKYIALNSKFLLKEFSYTAPVIKEICRLIMEFEREFAKSKKDRNILDYSDLEHMALNLLRDEDSGEPTDIANKIAQNTFELLVDEFQDTNEIQDRIFEAIKPKTGNVFYVGDVKQSIYKFRLANPVIFVDKYKSAKPYSESQEGEPRRIDLNKNFRSRTEVLQSVNFVFSQIMTEDFGNIDYDEAQALHLGADYEGEIESEFTVIDMSSNTENEDKKAQVEANYVAYRINELLNTFEVSENGDKRRAKPQDFAILLSSFSNKRTYYQKALEKWGIPCAVSKKEKIMDSVEISTILALLKIIDNPYQDIALAALMSSPICNFTSDDIAQMRILEKTGYLYEGLLKMQENGNLKVISLLEKLESYRNIAREQSTAKLLEEIYEDNNLISIFMGYPKGENRCKNLELMVSAAEKYENNGYKGLFRFISYFENKYKEESDEGATQGSGVSIMSIHKSKGLEFPVVVLPDLAKDFNRQDTKKSVLFHEDLQIGIKYKDKERMTVYKSQSYLSISAKIQKEMTEEEMRKLYVAMTRAREKLIMVCAFDNASNKIKSYGEDIAYGLKPSIVAKSTSFAQWLIYSYLSHKNAGCMRGVLNVDIPVKAGSEKINFQIVQGANVKTPEDIDVEIAEKQEEKPCEIPKWINEKYRYSEAVELTSKLSPTMIKRLRGDEIESLPNIKDRGKNQNGIARGNAIHHLMEKLDFKKCNNLEEIRSQATILYSNGILQAEEEKYIDYDKISNFFKGKLGEVIRSSQGINKEVEFAVLFNSCDIIQNSSCQEKIVINGAIDLLLEQEEGIIIVDYKSDYVPKNEEKETAFKHKEQIEIYAKAAERLYNKKVLAKYIYLFNVGKAVEII